MTDNPLTASLTAGELTALTTLSDMGPGELSPLADVDLTPDDMPESVRAALLETGWLRSDGPLGLTDTGRAALTCLLRPRTRIGLVMGDGDSFSSTISCASGDLADDELLLSVAGGGDDWHLAFGQHPTELVAILQDHFDLPVVDLPAPLHERLDRAEYLALLSLFDHRVRSRFEAALDHQYWVNEGATDAEVFEALAEGRTGGNLNWQVTVSKILLGDAGLDEEGLRSALARLEGRGLVGRDEDGRWFMSEQVRTVAEDLLPVVRWASIAVDRLVAPGSIESQRIGVRYGFGAILLDHEDQEGWSVRSVSSMELADLLLNFRWPGGLRRAEGQVAAVPAIATAECPKCGAVERPSARYCPTCGGALKGAGR